MTLEQAIAFYEAENKLFPNLWDIEKIKREFNEVTPTTRKDVDKSLMFPEVDRNSDGWEMHQDEYYCWQGTRIPCWFE